MQRISHLLLLLVGSLLLAPKAHAIFELRATYNMLKPNPDTTQMNGGNAANPSAYNLSGIGADALVQIPLSGIGIGLRYEDLSGNPSGDNYSYKTKSQRTAVLLSYRFIDTILHIGPIFSYGLSHSGSIDVDNANGSYRNWKPDSISSYSAGVEAGVGLAAFVVGIEAGYQSTQFKSMKDTSGKDTSTPSVDLNGMYSKAFFGLGF